jgi:hypothetical protein
MNADVLLMVSAGASVALLVAGFIFDWLMGTGIPQDIWAGLEDILG